MYALQEQRRIREHALLVEEQRLAKKRADAQKASALFTQILGHHRWVVFWEWARACSGRAVQAWVFDEEGTERLLERVQTSGPGDPALTDCLVEAAELGLLVAMRAALDKVPVFQTLCAFTRSPNPSPQNFAKRATKAPRLSTRSGETGRLALHMHCVCEFALLLERVVPYL